MKLSTAVSLCMLFISYTLQAGERNDIPDCYQYAGLAELRPVTPSRELTIIVDETTPITPDLKKESLAHVLRFARPGDRISQYRISAYLPDTHMQLKFAGTVQAGPTTEIRASIGTNSLKKLDSCLAKQQQYFHTQIATHMGESFGDTNKQIVKSEIIFSLKQIAESWSKSTSDEKVLFIISDMLENSDYSSFYQNNQIRKIDAATEMKKIAAANLQAPLKGVRVFVQAAGLVPNSIKNGYRSGKMIQGLENFWRDYFSASGASLESFGSPVMTTDLY